MGKRKDRRERTQLFERVTQLTAAQGDDSPDPESAGHDDAPISDATLASSATFSPLLAAEATGRRELTKMKKFRFQLLHHWMHANLAPCRVADVGGGKGLLAYLLARSGWTSTVIDPVSQSLPDKYKDLTADCQVRIPPTERVTRIDANFAPEMAQNFDLLVAMHAHGCNVQILDAAARYDRSVILLPCCIIHEPLRPPAGTHWIECVAGYAREKGFAITPFRLNFKGQNIGLYIQKSDR